MSNNEVEVDTGLNGVVESARRLSIKDMRQPYHQRGESFTEDQLIKEPFQQFKIWFELALAMPDLIIEPTAMCLATATKEGKPSCRMVLLKGFDENGFKFCTNYNSRKGEEIAENPYAALNIFWEPMKKVVRVEGRIEKLSEEESTKYFHARPIASQITSSISEQSRVVESREFLTNLENQMKIKYENETCLPKPKHWGGFRVIPDTIEFWQGHVNRLHDRIRFRKLKDGDDVPDGQLVHEGINGWVYERLAP